MPACHASGAMQMHAPAVVAGVWLQSNTCAGPLVAGGASPRGRGVMGRDPPEDLAPDAPATGSRKPAVGAALALKQTALVYHRSVW